MKLRLVNKQQETPDVWSFFWEAEQSLSWKPGQFLYYNLDLPQSDPRGNTRHFTISTSPTEKIIQLTTKISDSVYKQTLVKLEPGIEIEAIGPRGDFMLDSEKENLQVFLAGGIGITPFRAFIKYAIDKQLSTPMHLIYSNSTPGEIVFAEELRIFDAEFANLKITHTITHPEESKIPWHGLTGRINSEMIQKILETGNWKLEIPTITWWVCGPPQFVSAMKDELKKLKVSPEDIEIEQFTGY